MGRLYMMYFWHQAFSQQWSVYESSIGLMCRESLINLSSLSSLFTNAGSLSCQPSLYYFGHVVLLPCTYCISQGTSKRCAGIIADQCITHVTFSYPTSKKQQLGDEIVERGCRKLCMCVFTSFPSFNLSIHPS